MHDVHRHVAYPFHICATGGSAITLGLLRAGLRAVRRKLRPAVRIGLDRTAVGSEWR